MTAARLAVSPFAPFDSVSDPPSVGHRWALWKHHFETYLIAINITNDAQIGALVLYQADEATQDIFKSLPVVENEAQDYRTALENLIIIFCRRRTSMSPYFNSTRTSKTSKYSIQGNILKFGPWGQCPFLINLRLLISKIVLIFLGPTELLLQQN